ncbi:MAG TPA: hypothetical protein VJ826_14420 [Candidatus Polarisedimenticolaceae bacterium]|nr:hypothetical protein [Candidatus Polarisedimenticolaceae bacterium]
MKTTTTFDPQIEETYWRENYSKQPYASGSTFDDFGPAYRYGWESYSRYPGRKYHDVENDLERGWENAKGTSKLTWMKAKNAVRDAWHRIERALPGDADNDGR